MFWNEIPTPTESLTIAYDDIDDTIDRTAISLENQGIAGSRLIETTRYILYELLKNGVEASYYSDSPSVNVTIEKYPQGMFSVGVENNGLTFEDGVSLGGRGIGLQEVRNIASQNGGFLFIDKTVNNDTRVRAFMLGNTL